LRVVNRPSEADKRAAVSAVRNWHADVDDAKRLETWIAEAIMQARAEGYERGYDEGVSS
jgi:hypothetical protein